MRVTLAYSLTHVLIRCKSDWPLHNFIAKFPRRESRIDHKKCTVPCFNTFYLTSPVSWVQTAYDCENKQALNLVALGESLNVYESFIFDGWVNWTFGCNVFWMETCQWEVFIVLVLNIVMEIKKNSKCKWWRLKLHSQSVNKILFFLNSEYTFHVNLWLIIKRKIDKYLSVYQKVSKFFLVKT